MATKKVLDSVTLQSLLQMIAVEIKKKSDEGHVHPQYITTDAFNAAISGINSFELQVVNDLPTENIDTHTIYLVPKLEEENDVYDEYLYIGGYWEHIGNTKVDLSSYATKDYVDNAVANVDVSEELSTKADKEHTHTKAEITDFAHTHTKGEITDFEHTHTREEIVNFDHNHTKDDIVDFEHVHTKDDITDFPTDVSAFNNDRKYQTEDEVNQAIANAITGGTLDLSSFATDEELALGLYEKADREHAHTKADITDFAHTHSIEELTDMEFLTPEEATTMWNTAKS